MALQFIYGPACCRHEQALVAHATHWLQQDESHEVFYLVPNHVKFETEVSVLKQFRQATQSLENETVASTRLQVFSFTRLAWYFLQYTGMYPTNQLSEAGLHMLLRKILLDQKEALVAFQGEIDQPGFIGKLADLFLELQDSQIDVTDLEGFQAALGQSLQEKDLSKKLADFQLLYTAYLELLNEREVGSKELITSLANYLKKQDLSHIMFIVSGFSRLTVREKELIEALLEQAGEIKISLVMDEASVDQLPVPFDMFHDVKKMYYQLYHRARYLQVPVLRDQRLTPKNPEHSLVKLDQFWRQTQGVTPSQKQSVFVDKTQENIRIWQCESLYSEINQVATEIRKLVAEKHIRYQDIEILTRNLPLYELIIPPVFNRHHIPFYLNQNLEMKHHPFVELIDSLFLIHKRYFRYRDIMRFLRTELFIPRLEDNQLAEWEKVRDDYRLAVDLTENVVLAYGYEGSDWLKEEDWVYIPYEKQGEEDDFYQTVQQVSNQVRTDLAHALSPFFTQLEQATTGQEGASLLYHFLVEIGVEQMLRLWRDQCIEQGKLDEAKVHEQTWQAFIQLLDEYVEILGETAFDLAQFEQIILSGLEGLTYSKVPTAIDQVKVSSFDLVHSTKNKVTFVIGALDGELPKKIENKTLLSDEERQQFTEVLPENKYLVKQTTVDLFKEPYIAYLAFESSEEYLYVSYPSNSEHLKDCQASPYVTRIHQQFGVPVEIVEAEPHVTFSPDRISTWRQLVSDLTSVKRQAIENNQTVDMMWLALEKKAQQESSVAPIMKQVMSSLLFKNIPETLDKDLVEKIYGQNIHGSVSKFESFHLCEYRYFMTYGLKLRERDVFDLTPAVTGDFYHEALDIFVKQVIGQGLALKNLDEAEIEQLTLNVLQEVFGQSKFAILEASNRMRYIKYQLGKTIREMGHILQQQSQRSGMLPAQTEVLFGQIMSEQGLSGLVFDLDQEHQLHIRGKIDRVDYLKETPPYLAVIDYKSSPHGLDYKNLYYGIAMQMITYLDVALLNAKKLLGETQVKPAGAFYLHIQNPLVDGYTQPEQQQIEKLKNFQYKGLLVEDDHLLEQLDVTLEPKESSLVYPYQMKKNATYSSKQYVKEEELDLLVKHNRRKFKEAGCAIYEGKVRLNPAYSQRKRIACEYCPFRSVCQFDVMLEENNYHRLENLSKEDVLDRLSVEEKGEEHDNTHTS
ncbi:PD-(D/E)XK nuclease family protein [Vagococcus humatus]|uniref:ATP-dependent helicase n=1 Tax=Vagococcus humatus TaxID=1889241 RepID=A0A429Z7L9_9ENTE|nr:PD-(D/E)XK nuclease family protein [Vagococcus humatus]RST89635.1 ATP-dependent helicase [Vagococcus humatus]